MAVSVGPAARFSRNHAYVGETPCFIDDDGRICAVGYLVEESARRDVDVGDVVLDFSR